MWHLMLGTRVRDGQRGAKDAAIVSPSTLKEVEFHLVKRLCTLATDCTAQLNQARRARNQHVDGRARRTRAESKNPSSHGGCGEATSQQQQRSHPFLPGGLGRT